MNKGIQIGFSIIGQERDSTGRESDKRWSHLRPTVAFATQETIPLQRCYLAWQPDIEGQKELVERVQLDIKEVLEARKDHRQRLCELVPVEIKFKGPFDFSNAFQTLVDKLEDLMTGDYSDTWNLNVGTGTHAMQFAMYMMADKHILPVTLRLIQSTSQSRDKEGTTYGSITNIIRTDDWFTLPGFRNKFEQKREGLASQLLPAGTTRNPKFHKLLLEMAKVGIETNEPLLLIGPTGSGKTMMAEEIHKQWARKWGLNPNNFRALNCAGLTPNLAQSDLFGHIKGAFTGADRERQGVLQAANKGTVFLDEIGELDLQTQALLLKAIEEKKFSKVGATEKTEESDFRLICATNRDLSSRVRSGQFREDLFARIRNWVYPLPALREIREDLPDLIDYALSQWWQKYGKSRNNSAIDFEPAARHEFLSFAKKHHWPGNHRDLIQAVNRMATLASLIHHGGKNAMGIDLVRDQISFIKQMGEAPSSNADDTILAEDFARHVMDKYPESALIDASEQILQDWTLLMAGENKAEACRQLYGINGVVTGNATAKWESRRRYLKPRIKGKHQ